MKKIHIIAPIVLIGAGICIYQYAAQTETKTQTQISSIKTIKPEKDITKYQNTFKALEEDLKEIKEFDKELETRLAKANKNNSDYDFKEPMETYNRMELEYKNKDVITPINDSPYVDFDGEHLDFSKSKHIKLEHSGFSKFVKDFYTETIDGDSPYMENYATFHTINSNLIYDYFTHRKRTGLNEKINNLTLPILTGGSTELFIY